MLVKPDERVPLARLLKFLELGERFAHDCAKAQAALAPEPAMGRFLMGQARQEGFHALTFQGAITWLAPGQVWSSFECKPLQHYRRLFDDAVKRRDFAETILAEQVILEGLGEVILKKLEVGLAKRNAPFRRLRRVVLLQEEAHHYFGRRTLEYLIANEQTSYEVLQQKAENYLALTDSMITTLRDLFESIEEDPAVYLSEHQRGLPPWLQKGEKSFHDVIGEATVSNAQGNPSISTSSV